MLIHFGDISSRSTVGDVWYTTHHTTSFHVNEILQNEIYNPRFVGPRCISTLWTPAGGISYTPTSHNAYLITSNGCHGSILYCMYRMCWSNEGYMTCYIPRERAVLSKDKEVLRDFQGFKKALLFPEEYNTGWKW